MYRTPFHYACENRNIKIISLFLNSEQLVGYANRQIDLNIQLTQKYLGYPISTTGYDILNYKNIKLDVVKRKNYYFLLLMEMYLI